MSPIRRKRAGATAVEFALTAPILFLFLIASIEFGRVNMVRGTLGNAAYEGARAAVTPGATANDAASAARELLNATFVRGATVEVQPGTITNDTEQVTVLIEVPLDQNSWIIGMFTRGMTVSNSRTLAREKANPAILAEMAQDPGGDWSSWGGKRGTGSKRESFTGKK